MNFPRRAVLLLLTVLAVHALTGHPPAYPRTGNPPVDARYAPLPSYSLICYPDDRLKSAVTDRGDLAYDFGPGPYAQPLTLIGVSLLADSLVVERQSLDDARVPVVRTTTIGTTGVVRTRAFSWGGRQPEDPGARPPRRWRRLGGENGCVAWAAPPQGTPPELRGVAWGTNRPILYRVTVPAGESRLVGLGFCESYKRSAKSRLLDIHVEGSPVHTIDPMPNGVKNEPVVVLMNGIDLDRDAELAIEIHPSPSGPDPNVILNAIWVFPAGLGITAEQILNGSAAAKAELVIPCGQEGIPANASSRVDILTGEVAGANPIPVVQVRSRRMFRVSGDSGLMRGEGGLIARVVPPPSAIRTVPGGIDIQLPPGTRSVTVYVGFSGDTSSTLLATPDPMTGEDDVKRWWLDSASVLYGRLTVPDPALQYLVDAGVRTMYQVRDRVDGKLQFQPGPSVYRGLWVGDIGVPWITALLLGDTAGTREYIDIVLSRQESDGQVRVMTPVPSLVETPMLVFGVVQYARATGNLPWLRERFPAIVAAVEWTRQMRRRSLEDPRQAHAGLFPPGFVDGGISTPATDFGTVFWTLIGLEHAIDAARMLGRKREEADWAALLGDFNAPLRAAILRDGKPDSGGAMLLPVTVGNTVAGPPQRGMASQVFPVPFGKIYEQDTLLQQTVRGSLAYVDKHQEQGLPVGVGWLAEGLWPSWFGPFAAIAHTLYGDPDRARGLLYAIANHATGAGSWAEEQLPRRLGPGTGGDMANAQSAAAFVLGLRWLIARERANDLELFTCVPPDWLRPGSRIALQKNAGRFGTFSVQCEIDSSGRAARVQLTAPDGRNSPGSVRIFYQAFREAGFSRLNGGSLPVTSDIKWGTSTVLELKRD